MSSWSHRRLALALALTVSAGAVTAVVYTRRERRLRRRSGAAASASPVVLDEAVAEAFEEAATWVVVHESTLDDNTRLALYSLYKQATVGPCASVSLPFPTSVSAAAKRHRWRSLGDLGAAEAMARYVGLVLRLSEADGEEAPQKGGAPLGTPAPSARPDGF